MIKTLELHNCFTHKHRTFDFTKGLTAIVGPNGSGKSLILEMIQYALWGSSALRGTGPDYKGLQVDLVFEVKGVEYTVRRMGGTVRLVSGDTDLASGTKAVNPYIRNLFGYSFEAFKMANAINQGKIEELGNMLPTARKKLVDQTIGLDRLDGVSEWISEQEKDLRATIAAAEKYLLEPVEPPMFHVEQSAVSIFTKKVVLEDQLAVYRLLEAQANAVVMEPQEVAGDLSALEATQRTREAALTQERTIQQALKGFPEPGPKPETHPLADRYAQLVDETESFKASMTQKAQIERMLGDIPKTIYTQAAVDEADALLKMIVRWKAKLELKSKLAEYVCPACDHHWHDEDPRLADYADVPDVCPTHTMVRVEVDQARKALAQAETRKGLEDALVLLDERLVDKQDWTKTIKEISESVTAQKVYEERLRQQDQKAVLEAQLAAIEVPWDVSDQITAKRQYLKALEVYQTAKANRDTAITALADLPADLEAQVLQAHKDWLGRRDYETALAAYQKAKERYDAQLAEVQVARTDLEDWGKCKQAIATLRQRVKGYLLPSLNKVASHLLQTMTAGVLNWIVVSEDFDITVDGQRLETLSGAGKSVANLALRIGLGQVLTNKTFSVLLLDEIDASCDDARATAIAESLQRLTGQIKQIIQVSHKQGLVADQYVRL
jgi:DNA repair exonuclease SbcCD ATPase subunit